MMSYQFLLYSTTVLYDICTYVCIYTYIRTSVSYNTVVLYSRDRYEIIGLRKSSHSIKQPCSSICLKKAFAMHQSC